MNLRPTLKTRIGQQLAYVCVLLGLVGCADSSSQKLNTSVTQTFESALQARSKSPKRILKELEDFVRNESSSTFRDPNAIASEMENKIHELDSLAIPGSLSEAAEILNKVEGVHRLAIATVQQQQSEGARALWLQWSERLILTRSSLQLYFSESLLNRFESKLDNMQISEALAELPVLKSLLHPVHEARVASIYRSQFAHPNIASALLDLLATSGGPLARLFIFQKFSASPTIDFAEALAKCGLPRTSDLLGNNALAPNGPFTYANEREGFTPKDLFSAIKDFPERWKDMKEYLEALREIPERLQKARAFWLTLHEDIERKLEALPVSQERITELKNAILQSFRSKNKTAQMSYRRDGIEFKEGDIVLVQSGEAGGLWETFTHSGSLLSHMQMVTFDEHGLPYTIEMNFGRILLAPLDLSEDRFVVLRLRHGTEALRERMHASFRELLSKDIRYDFQFDSTNHQSLYCSELAAAVLESSEAGVTPFAVSPASPRAEELLRKSGINSQIFYGQGSYLGSSNFEFVGQRIHADPHDLIRGQMILSAFTEHLANASAVRLSRHQDSPTILGLSTMAQTLDPELKRGLGPQSFLFTVLVLDRLIREVGDDVRNSNLTMAQSNPQKSSRIVTLKNNIANALSASIPEHLSVVFPKKER